MLASHLLNLSYDQVQDYARRYAEKDRGIFEEVSKERSIEKNKFLRLVPTFNESRFDYALLYVYLDELGKKAKTALNPKYRARYDQIVKSGKLYYNPEIIIEDWAHNPSLKLKGSISIDYSSYRTPYAINIFKYRLCELLERSPYIGGKREIMSFLEKHLHLSESKKEEE